VTRKWSKLRWSTLILSFVATGFVSFGVITLYGNDMFSFATVAFCILSPAIHGYVLGREA